MTENYKRVYYKMSYYPPYKSSINNIKVELDLTNYATKIDLNNITHVDTSSFASKTNLAALKTIENETKEQRGGFLGMLLGTLGASLLGNLLTCEKGIMRAGDGIVRAGDGIVRAGEGSIASRAKGDGSKKNP